jgi:hypothetical protein
LPILFQVLFEYELIRKFEQKDFLPWLSNKSRVGGTQRLKSKIGIDDSMYFVRIAPRRNLHLFVQQENIIAMWFFINQQYIRRSNAVIPALE